MSYLVPLRSYNRSGKVRIGGKALTPSVSKYVNLDNVRVQKDLNRHAAIGTFIHAGPAITQGDDGVVDGGGVVSVQATGLTLNASATSWTSAAKVKGNAAAGTATVGAADGTNPRIDILVVNTGSGAYSIVAGTATAGASLTSTRSGVTSTFLAGLPAVPASSIALAYILVPTSAANLVQTNVLDVRP